MNGKQFRTKFLLDKLKKNFTNLATGECIDLSSIPLKNILIVSPHADDEIIGCGGLMQLLVETGAIITVLIVTQEGDRSISKWMGNKSEDRVTESFNAKDIIGYDELIYFTYPELELGKNSDLQESFIIKLKQTIESLKPSCVFIPNMNEIHPDHRIIGELCLDEIIRHKKTGGYNFITKILIYEVWGPVEMNSYIKLPESIMKKKIDSLACYKTQLQSVDYISILEFLNTKRGSFISKQMGLCQHKAIKYAEAFKLIDDTMILTDTKN